MIDIAIGHSVRSRKWKNESMTWEDLVTRLSKATKTRETFKEFMKASKQDQLTIKDVGGYVGGYLRGGKRSPANVAYRQLLTLDLDFAPADFWEMFTMLNEVEALVHATHKHSNKKPRLRLLVPLSREVSPDEYSAISRAFAGEVGIDYFDSTTFEVNRLMFWPSHPSDVEYYVQHQTGPWLDADQVLNSYADWTDTTLWPTPASEVKSITERKEKQQDPREKGGVIGAFCKAFTISEVIEKYLSEIYTPAGEDRYSYAKGSTAGGLTVYDDTFAYSHHGTDPCSGQLCNTFDLVRVHKFAYKDSGDARTGTRKSTEAMEEFASKIKAVRRVLTTEVFRTAKEDFADLDIPDTINIEWATGLEVDGKGVYKATSTNINLILSSDPLLKDKFIKNEFESRWYITGNVPWRKVPKLETFKDVDFAGVRNYLDTLYSISARQKVEDSLSLIFEKNSIHPVRDYLKSLTWDGVPRVQTLLVDYLGAEDSDYTRAATKCVLTGAVARIFEPGIKFDLVLTLVGKQGTGKSTLMDKLGGQWFSDSFHTVKGKEAFEQLQGAWIIEMAELAGLRKAEIEVVKHFITKRSDSYRWAYGHFPEHTLRQCVFFGTVDKKAFLNDPSGNRRFLPVDVDREKADKDVFNMPKQEVDQVWAEAMVIYRDGGKLYLDRSIEQEAVKQQRSHSEIDGREGVIQQYLNTALSEDWAEKDLFDRQLYYQGVLPESSVNVREFVCVAEVWCECMGRQRHEMNRYVTREINDILRSQEDWIESTSTKNFKLYGTQRYYYRK